MKLLIPAVLLLCLTYCPSCQPSQASITTVAAPTELVVGALGNKLEQKLSPFIEKILRDHDCQSSLSIGVTKGGKVIYAKAFGLANVQTGDSANLTTVYHLASIAKTFVASAIIKLQAQGKLDVNDRVVDHLPYFKLQSPAYQEITIKQLLTHTSGLPSHLRLDEWKKPSYAENAVETYVRSAKDAVLEFAPGTDFNYSDVGYITLGDIIAKAAGMNFESYIVTQLFEPAGMDHSTFLKPRTLPENWAAPHIVGTNTQVWEYYPYNREYAPCNALHSTVLDMCKWGVATLDRGKSGQAIMDTSSYNLLLSPWEDTPWGEKIGFSWFLQQYEGMATVLHTGADIGFSAQMIMYPEEDVCIVVLANRAYSRTARIANATMEVIKDLGIKDYQVSARFPFGKVWDEKGFDSARELWIELLKDTTDNYYANEGELNSLGHGLLFTEEYDKALQAFALNIEMSPGSPNTYDSYGDGLLAIGDTSKAIKYFKKALAVDPDFPDPGPKLEKLKAKQGDN